MDGGSARWWVRQRIDGGEEWKGRERSGLKR